ncbi:leucine-rich repeat-containing protein 9-like [Anneissia japonica]|uniref:leucine-rich repeat-containing protein 9-like n=1 Tax=Anneissia japonica TaxID=1529436 RepID=UPI00142593E1|nr:leucine-rich repeat-containing protein 9-like [Anneissia japonica]
MYAPNPVCSLCNYSTHILYHLPQLQRLDTVDVSNKAMRELAEATVVKKKMYYNMRVKTLKRNMAEMLLHLRRDKAAFTKATRDRIKNVSFMMKEVIF